MKMSSQPILTNAICPICDTKQMNQDEERRKMAYCGNCGIVSKIADLKGVRYE